MPAYSGGVIDVRSTVLGAVPAADGVALIAASAAAAGWTVTDLGFWNFLEYSTSIPANNDTVTINGQVYTYKTTLTPAANEVLIGSTPLAAAQNLKAAINGEAGAGTLYGAGTSVNTGVTAISAGEVMTTTINTRVQLWVVTKTGAAIAVSETAASLVWGNTTTLGGKLYKFVSATTPGYQIGTVFLGGFPLTSTNTICLLLQSRDATTWGGCNGQQINVNGDSVRVISHRYGVHYFPVGLYGTSSQSRSLFFQVPHLYENTRPNKVTGATNTTPIEITTELAHGYVTGDSVSHKYIQGNTGANGVFVITVTSPTKYTLNGSAGTGTFTGTLGLAQNLTSPRKEISDAVFGSIDNGGSTRAWSVNLYEYGDVGQRAFQIVDGVFHRADAAKAWGLFIDAYMGRARTRAATGWGNGTAPAVEAGIVFDSLYGSPSAAMGQLYNIFTARAPSIPGGASVTYDGRTWYGVYNNDVDGQLFIATS